MRPTVSCNDTARSVHAFVGLRRGKLAVIGAGIASVVVRPHNVPRALVILDALFEAAEDAGLSVTTKSIPTALAVLGVQVPFSLTENLRGLLLILGDDIGEGHRLWADTATERLQDRATDIVAAARLHALAIEAREERIAERASSRRAEELERAQFSKRLTLLRERADMLEETEKLGRLLTHLRQTDDGSAASLAGHPSVGRQLHCDPLPALQRSRSRSRSRRVGRLVALLHSRRGIWVKIGYANARR